VVPLLLLLVLGIAEFGRAYNIQTTLSGAAREGVRAMAVQNDPAAARAATENAAQTLDLSAGQISVSPGVCPEGGMSEPTNVTVTVSYQMAYLTNLFGSSLQLTGKAVMQCNG